MLNIVCLFFSAFLSMLIYENVLNRKFDSTFKKIEVYALFSLFINLCTFGVIFVFSQNPFFEINRISFIFKFLLVSIVFSSIMPFIFHIIVNNMKINVRFKEIKSEKKK